MTKRTLIKGARILTMDTNLPDMLKGDILIEGTKIKEIAQSIEAGNAEVIDAEDMIAIPGLIDSHRHVWQSMLRATAVDWTLGQYFAGVRGVMGRLFTAEDMYVANWMGALECLDAGITTVLDWSHNNNTPDHADGAIKGLMDAGIRAVYAYGDGNDAWLPVSSTPMNYQDVKRIHKEYFLSDNQLLTMAIASRGPQFSLIKLTAEELKLAKELDIMVTMHTGDGAWGACKPIESLYAMGLLDENITYAHCNTLTDEEYRIIGATGAKASMTPEIELNMGHGFPATLKLLAAGVEPGIGQDIMTSASGELFSCMRSILSGTRSVVNGDALKRGIEVDPLPIMASDALRYATMNGAKCCNLEHKIGSLTPGKEADIVLINTNSLNMIPMNNPYGIIAEGAHVGNVDTVFVAGKAVKRQGKLIGVDVKAVRRKVDASRDSLFKKAGVPTDGSWLPTPYSN